MISPEPLDQPAAGAVVARHRPLRGWPAAVFIALTVLGLLLVMNQLFNLRFFAGVTLLENQYLYLLLGAFLSLVFLAFPSRSPEGGQPSAKVPWYDVVLFLAALATTTFFAWHAERIVTQAWEFTAPTYALAVGIVLWLLLLEGARRTGGSALMVIVFLFSLYPVVAGRMPGPIRGFDLSFADTMRYHTMGVEAVLGIPMRVFGTLFVGFIVFGAALQVTGGGRFFANLALAAVGRFRGGPAKVAIIASALFGSMSGSAVSNVLSTGQITIPTMIRTGFHREGAAAVEANASSGGTVMPPVMAATAFLMATILGVPYVHVAAAAVVPIALYFVSLFFQLDAYAAKNALRGVPREETPGVVQTLKEGWFYLFAFLLLVYLLVFLRREATAPFYATGVLVLVAMIRKDTRWTRARAAAFVVSTGRLLSELVAILAAVGFLVGALAVTGLAGTISSDLVRLAGGNVTLLVIVGAVACFILGTGMTITAAYVFLAITMAPALVAEGLNPMAVHLFVLYWASLSNVTPPVGLAVVAAAGVAGARLMPAMLESVRFAAVKYALPFFFISSPMLVLQGVEPVTFTRLLVAATIGLGFVAYALQGYLPGLGSMNSNAAGWTLRLLLIAGGALLAAPEARTSVLGLAVAAACCLLLALAGRSRWLPAMAPRMAPEVAGSDAAGEPVS
ncbi:MAG: TRAP transporter fused permease subunit [Nitriliruptorales bacterium]|nr:TRAP transporter fused permease subunit [Nitriliruptorales bacterium]